MISDPNLIQLPKLLVLIVVHGFYHLYRCHLCLSSWELDVQQTGDGASLRWKVSDFHGMGSEQNPGRSNGAYSNIVRSLQKQGETNWTWKNELWTNWALSQMYFGFAIEELHCSTLCRKYSWRPLDISSIICQSLCFWQIFMWIPCCLSCLAEMWNPDMVTFEGCLNPNFWIFRRYSHGISWWRICSIYNVKPVGLKPPGPGRTEAPTRNGVEAWGISGGWDAGRPCIYCESWMYIQYSY